MTHALQHNTGVHKAPADSVRLTSIDGTPFTGVPTALRDLNHWVVRKGKVPHQPRNLRYGASSTNPQHWSDLTTATRAAQTGLMDGLGFVFSSSLGMVFIDLDDCFDESGSLNPYAADIVAMFPTHWHISMSGKGLHGVCYGTIPAALKNSDAGVEMYSSERYMAWPVDPMLWGDVSEVTDCSEAVSALYRRYAKSETQTAVSVPVNISDDVEGILERMSQTPKHAALLRGDASDYAGWSEARMGLAYTARFWNLGESDIADVLLRSNLFKPEDDERERRRRAANDAAKACKTYTGSFYDPNYGNHTDISLVLGNGAPVPDTSGLPDDVDALKAELARERALREQMQIEITGVREILASPEYEAGAKLTAIGVYLEGLNQQRLRRKPTEDGYHLPAGWIGKTVGMKTATVNNNLNKLKKAGVVDRTVRSEEIETPYRDIDQGSGEITDGREKRRGKRSYIKLPDNMIEFVAKVAEYRKDPVEEPEKRGGIRVPACDKHPDAQLVRRTAYYCEGCYHEAQRDGTPIPPPLLVSDPARVQRDDSDDETVSTPNFGGDTATVSNGYAKFGVDPDDAPLVPRCDWHIGEGEECGEPTVAWIHEGYGSQTKCERHSGAPPQRLITTSRVLRTEVAS